MKKTTAIACILGALLLGVAIAAYAQVVWVQVVVKYDNTTTYPVLSNQTQWVYVWRAVADSKGITYGDCDAACRRLIVGEKMRETFNAWLYQQIANKNNSTANATTAAQVEALQGMVE